MTLPYTFTPGSVAAAGEVNANFAAFDAVLGTTSTAAALILPGTFLIGPRENAQLSAESDTSYGSDSYLQIGWNAELYNSSGWKVRRFHNSEHASMIRLGRYGISLWTTHRATGDLNSQIKKKFAVGYDQWLFVDPDVHIQNVDAPPTVLADYRMTYVGFDNPSVIYQDTAQNVNTVTYTASNYNVPSTAIAVNIVAYIKTGATGGGMKVMQARSSPSVVHGFGAYAGPNEEAANSGIVHLGRTGSYAGKFVEQRTVNFTKATLSISGYFI